MKSKFLKAVSIVMSAAIFVNSGSFVCAQNKVSAGVCRKKSKQDLISGCLIGAAVVAGLAYIFQDEIKEGISNIVGKTADADSPAPTSGTAIPRVPTPASSPVLAPRTPSPEVEPASETEDEIKADLASKAESLKRHRRIDGTPLNNPREALCYLLGSQEAVDYADANYPEWKERFEKDPYNAWGDYTGYENYALMSMAYSLRLARATDYHAEDPSNNELLFKDEGLRPKCQVFWEEGDALKNKIVIENKTAVQSIDDHYEDGKNLCALNAGDPYEPGGFLPGCGSVVEECYSMQTDDLKDLSHKIFRGDNLNEVFGSEHKFYCTRDMYAPLQNFNRLKRYGELSARNASSQTYATKGIFTHNVRFIRSPQTWNNPDDIANFDLSNSKIKNKKFSMLTIAGLEDRARNLLWNIDSGTGALIAAESPYRELWKDITMRQCRFILNTMVNRGVDIPVLVAFTAGAFGGDAKIVADCFKKLLIDEGYANYFTKVVFAIKCASNASYNIRTFSDTFGVPIVG